ncbi:MAG: hypothetical protein II415_06495 [Bacteroidaceae bacterium]|nr:hypothetical protein [Bacteroidaceae bacterium]
MKLLIILLFTFHLPLFTSHSPLFAQDYVDAINEASQAQEGKRVVYEMNIGSFTPQGTLHAAQQQCRQSSAWEWMSYGSCLSILVEAASTVLTLPRTSSK